MDKLVEHGIRMLEIEGKGKNDGYIETRNMGDIARAVYDTILRVQVLERKADRKTEPSNSEIPNNCDTCRFELYCPEMCEGCCEWDSHYEPKDKPQIDDFFREPTTEERKAVADYIDSISVPTGVNVFDLMDEPQTERSE